MPRFPALLLAALLLAAGGASPSQAADPVAFAEIVATCDPADGLAAYFADPVTTAQPQVAVRYEVKGGAVALDGATQDAGEVTWDLGDPLQVGEEPSVLTDCSEAAAPSPFAVAFHPYPEVPAAFSGVGASAPSALPVLVSTAGPYLADVTVGGGSIAVSSPDGSRAERTFAADGQYELGRLSAGAHVFPVKPVAGGRPVWTIRIRPKPPVTVSGLSMPPALTSRTGPVTGSVTVDGETTLSINVENALGQGVRSLLAASTVPAGTYPVAWDGRGATGDLPDGSYQIVVRSKDATGTESVARAPVKLDRTLLPARLAHTFVLSPDTVKGSVPADPSGIASVTVTADGRTTTLAPGTLRFELPAPSRGRTIGKHVVTVTTVDGAGNTRTDALALNVLEVYGEPCGTNAAKSAVLTSRTVRAALEKTRAGRGRDVRTTFRVRKVVCAELTGDRTREMVVQLSSTRRTDPTPLVVFRTDPRAGFKASFVTTRYRFTKVGTKGRTLVLRAPGEKRYEVRYSNRAFSLRAR